MLKTLARQIPQIDRLVKSRDQLHAHVGRLAAETRDLKNVGESLNGEVARLTKERGGLQRRIETLQERASECEQLKARVATLQEQATNTDAELRTFRGQQEARAAYPKPTALLQKHIEGAHLFANRDVALASLPQGGRFAEIGVAYGDFSQKVIDTLKPARFDAYDIFRLHEIETIWGRPSAETFQGRSHREFYEARFADHIGSGRMHVFEGDSSTMLSDQPDGSYDVIYIDGDHTLDAVRRDAAVAVRKVAKNGFLVFNDYIIGDHHGWPYGVVQTVNTLCTDAGWRVRYLALNNMMFCDICLGRAAP